MSRIEVSQLFIYPIKSSAGVSLTSATIAPGGFLGDRCYVITRLDGSFITGRTHPNITAITSQYHDNILSLKYPDRPVLRLDPTLFTDQYSPTTLWNDNVMGQNCGPEADQWISEVLGEPLKLIYFGKESQRPVTGHESYQVSFADGFPYLLIGDNSLDHLNQRLPAPISMQHFRPNITLSGSLPFAEDEWATIRIGEVIFDLVKPCGRCVFTTVNPYTHMFDKASEPLKTLATYRKLPDGSDVTFGENLLAVNTGTIRVGDCVEIIKTHKKIAYVDNWSPLSSRIAQHFSVQKNTDSAKSTKISLRCVDVIEETADVKTFNFVAEPVQLFSYYPGQFITLHLPIDGETYNRCYTLSSSPSRPNMISITVKRVAEGKISNWLHDHLYTGASIEASTAAGVFHLGAENKNKLLLLSAGSGITPMLSILRYITDLSLNYDVHFHHSAHSEADFIALNELQLIAQRHKNISLSCNFTQSLSSDIKLVSVQEGRISEQIIKSSCEDFMSRDTFVCGPEGFMTTAKSILIELGLPESQYQQESFDLNATTPSTNAINHSDNLSDNLNENINSTGPFTVEFVQSGLTIEVDGEETILDAAENAGIGIDYSCRGGVCGSCNTQLLEGDIHAPDALALDADDIANGEFLACCSFARSNLKIDA